MSHPPFFFPSSSPLSSLLLSPSPPPLSSTPLPLSLLIFVYSWSHDSSLSPPHQRELNRWIGVETCRGEHFHSTKEQAVERGRERGREGGGREGGREGGMAGGGWEERREERRVCLIIICFVVCIFGNIFILLMSCIASKHFTIKSSLSIRRVRLCGPSLLPPCSSPPPLPIPLLLLLFNAILV